MATDPTGPVQYIPTQRVDPTDNAIKMQREYAAALMKDRYTPPNSKYPFYTWANGAADMSKQLLGAYYLKDADEKERKYYDKTRDNSTPTNDPASSATTPTAASGGAAPATPFTQTPQRGSTPSSPPSPTSSSPPTLGSAEEPKTQGRPSQMAALESGDIDSTQAAAMRLHTKAETGKNGMAALFNISPDTKGSKSYGPFGLNSRSGSAAELAKEHPELELTAPPGTPEFDAQWKRAASLNSGADMQKAHEDWHQKHIMSGLPEQMIKAGVDPNIANDPRVQTYMADRKVQMGGAGLNNALMSGRSSSSPEEFLGRVSQADKERIPSNFASYLQGHPNDVRGLNNRIDLRHNTALSGADPDLTAAMVDHHLTKNAVGTQLAQNGPPTAGRSSSPTYPRIDYTGAPSPRPGVPAATPGPAPPNAALVGSAVPMQGGPPPAGAALPQGALESDFIRAYRGLITAGMNPEAALKQATELTTSRQKFGPQFGEPNALGQGLRSEPMKPPAPYMVPGLMGQIGAFGKTPLKSQTYIGPDGQVHERVILPEFGATPSPPGAQPIAPTGAPTPPTTLPNAVAAPAPLAPVTPPAATPTGPGGILTATPPVLSPTAKPAEGGVLANAPPVDESQQPFKLASNVIMAPGKPVTAENTVQAEQVAEKSGDNGDSKKFVAEALALPRIGSSYIPPDVVELARQAQSSDPAVATAARNKLIGFEQLEKSESDAAKFRDEGTAKENAEISKAITEGGAQAIKLQQALKLAKRQLQNQSMEFGPFAGTVTDFRNLTGEVKKYLQREKNEDGTPKYPGAIKWIDSLDIKSPAANQAYSKLISGSVLQSLRNMLGPNAGQFRVQELKLLEQAFGNQNLSKEGNQVVMDIIDKLNDRAILTNRMANEYKKARGGTIDANFNDMMDRYAEAHPSFNPSDYDKLTELVTGGKDEEPPPVGGGILGTTPPAVGSTPNNLSTPEEIQRERERRRAR